MTTYRLTKNNTTIHLRISKTEAEMRRTVDDQESTTRTWMTPMEGNRKVNSLLRQGYTLKKAGR